MEGLTDGPVKTYLFRLEFNTLEEAIRVAEQEDFSEKQAHANSNSYRPSRRQENGGPEPMDLCYSDSEISCVTIIRICRHAIDVERQYLCLRMRFPERGTTYCTYLTVKRQRMVRGVGPTLLRERNIVTDSSKMVRVGRCGAHY